LSSTCKRHLISLDIAAALLARADEVIE